ncbi:NO-inducible flavohemoprotein [Methylobacterium radiodurans]|uniref:nitric oxide dioxygenase n=1 Tax=Methylobacterium radiodurans TaxID=2202828 RepID=A0A2U8VTS8_9HYPH|nr:NO-inducible flavohemoprotein [Methylobacterium radiodurans]AWN37229.1 NO-inducible flavohemoprotein [Methylobacterium radiodurans]
MPEPLNPATVALIKATVPALEAHGLAITRRMYERLFENPEIRDLFNQSHHGETGSQPKALAQAVLAYARHIDDLGALGGAVERIAQKHVALNILPEHYPHVADALLAAIRDVLGEAATPEICAAWGEAYWFLAEILIGREAALYRAHAAAPGGWTGWRAFRVESLRDESEAVRSFWLVPADGGSVMPHRPGQYLGFRVALSGGPVLKRNYSISCAPNARAYRISVKRESRPGLPEGLVSNWLHDHAGPGTVLEVAAPAGEFVLEGEGPVVLASGGVGLTPLLSMAETLAAGNPDRPVLWAHGTQSRGSHAFAAEMRVLAERTPGLTLATFYEDLAVDAPLGPDAHRGRITAGWLVEAAPAGATFYLCGPKPFLATLTHGLAARGVPAERIRYEFFGPADELAAPELEAA